MYFGLQFQTKTTKQQAPPQPVKTNLMQTQSQSRSLGGNMIDAVKKTKKGCSKCGT